MKKYRSEWKYLCNESNLSTIEQRIKEILPLDSHANSQGTYTVHSLYFDDLSFSCASDTEIGIGIRYKYRIRYYGNSSQFLRLERKEKKYGKGRKNSCFISQDTFSNIINGQIDTVFWNTDNPTLKQFCIDIWTHGFMPKVIIDYERVAYVDEATNTRITFDKNISSSVDISSFLDRSYVAVPILEQGKHILEVKFDDILPGYIKNAVYLTNLQQTSFSKYYLGIQKIRR